MELITGIVLTITSAISGAAVGYGIYRLKHRNNYSAQLYNEYKQMAQELAAILEDLLTLSMRPQKYSHEFCMALDKELSRFYFKYYLVLPQSVLEEMGCLHACLQTEGKYFFMVEKTKEPHVLRRCETAQEINNLFTDIALTKTRTYEKYTRIPNYINLKCQARHVIIVMQDCWSSKDFHRWQKK